jgi:hypothetical protein
MLFALGLTDLDLDEPSDHAQSIIWNIPSNGGRRAFVRTALKENGPSSIYSAPISLWAGASKTRRHLGRFNDTRPQISAAAVQ